MPIIYPKAIRRKFQSLNLEKVKESLLNKGYEFVRDGGFRPEDEPFKFSNYLFYSNNETGVRIRIGYNLSYGAIEPIYKLKPIRLCGDDIILEEEALIELYNKIN